MRNAIREGMNVRKAKDIPTVRVEILPPEPKSPKKKAQDAADLIKRLVQEQVAEVLANRDDFLFRPFFDSKKVADELRRLQTVPEHLSWGRVFAMHGCIICGEGVRGHTGCGCCDICYHRVNKWKKTAIKELEEERRASEGSGGEEFERNESEIIRLAFVNPVAALPPADIKKRRRDQK
jgi:hypothetical protein